MVMTFNCISLIMATIVMNIKKRGDEKQCPDVPKWMLWLCHNVLSKIVCTTYLWKDDILCPNNNNNTSSCEETIHPQNNNHNTDIITDNTVLSEPTVLPAVSSDSTQLRQRRGHKLETHPSADDQGRVRGEGSETELASSAERMFHMKRQWFFVAEVADKFAFLIYLITMSFTVFMILYVVPVHMRNDPKMT